MLSGGGNQWVAFSRRADQFLLLKRRCRLGALEDAGSRPRRSPSKLITWFIACDSRRHWLGRRLRCARERL